MKLKSLKVTMFVFLMGILVLARAQASDLGPPTESLQPGKYLLAPHQNAKLSQVEIRWEENKPWLRARLHSEQDPKPLFIPLKKERTALGHLRYWNDVPLSPPSQDFLCDLALRVVISPFERGIRLQTKRYALKDQSQWCPTGQDDLFDKPLLYFLQYSIEPNEMEIK